MATNGTKSRRDRGSRSDYKGVCIRKDLRLAIHLRDGFRCLYCCQDLHDAAPQDLTLDHLTSFADGGGNKPKNLVTACRHCNCSRRDMPLAEFAGPVARADIRRNARRAITRYRVLARELIAGRTGQGIE